MGDSLLLKNREEGKGALIPVLLSSIQKEVGIPQPLLGEKLPRRQGDL